MSDSDEGLPEPATQSRKPSGGDAVETVRRASRKMSEKFSGVISPREKREIDWAGRVEESGSSCAMYLLVAIALVLLTALIAVRQGDLAAGGARPSSGGEPSIVAGTVEESVAAKAWAQEEQNAILDMTRGGHSDEEDPEDLDFHGGVSTDRPCMKMREHAASVPLR